MPLFSRRLRRQIGIDIGTSSIKIAELSRGKTSPELLNYGIIDGLDFFGDISSKPKGASTTFKMSEFEISSSLKELVRFSNIETIDAVVSIPIFSSFLTVIDLPVMSEKELEKAVPFQARSYIPVSLSEVVVDWTAIPSRSLGREKMVSPNIPKSSTSALPGNIKSKLDLKGQLDPSAPYVSGGIQNEKDTPTVTGKIEHKASNIYEEAQQKTSVLLVAVPKEVVAKYERIVAQAGLRLGAVEAESFSLVRSLVAEEREPVMVIDFGARSTTLTIVDQGFVRMTHNIDLSGKEITKVISRGLGVSEARAEVLKKTAGLASRGGRGRGITDLITPIIGRVVVEFEKMTSTYKRKEGVDIGKTVLTGGTAKLSGMIDYLVENLKTPTSIGDPFGKILVSPFIKGDLRVELASKLSVSVGLAMRNF